MDLMPVPSDLPPLHQLGCMPFAFDPAIAGVEPNEWRYAGCNWAEVVVVNARTGLRVGIPRQFVGMAATFDECGIVVCLAKQLEFCAGSARPAGHRIIPMTITPDPFRREPSGGPATVVPIRLDSGRMSRMARTVWCALAVGMAGSVFFAYLYRGEIIDSRTNVRPPVRAAHF